MTLHCVRGVGGMTLRVERVQDCGLLLVLEEGEGCGKKERHRRCGDDALLV